MPHRIRYPQFDQLLPQDAVEVRDFCEAVLDQEARELSVSVSGNFVATNVNLADPIEPGQLRIEMPITEVLPTYRHEGYSYTGENLRDGSGVEAEPNNSTSSAKFILSKTVQDKARDQWLVEVARDPEEPVQVTYPKGADKRRVLESIRKSIKKATLD